MDDRSSEPQPGDMRVQPTSVHTGIVVTPPSHRLNAGSASRPLLTVRDLRAIVEAALDELDELGDRIANATRLR